MSYFELFLANARYDTPKNLSKFANLRWKNVDRDGLPEDKAEILISVNGVYYISEFDGPSQLFRVIDGRQVSVFHPEDYHIYWSEFSSPN